MKEQDRQEALLISRSRGGDHRAFESLVRLHQRPVYNLALRMLGSPEDAEDVLQETFLALFRSLARFRGGSALSTYLYRLAANFSLMKLRRRRSRREKLHVGLDREMERADPGAFSLDKYLVSEARELLERFLVELKDQERAAVVLGDIEGFRDREASGMLGLRLPAYKSRLRRGRENLRKKLLPYLKPMETR
ncbi:MAG TPA: RNA polymerase subunit sigma [candidate division Zixibacteria bacterium]|jgi:RNA polymerase sigma-70 factor (ECF subfamily)|nr:RNA polymerase subunit sigma [candidate division Zixibacteria bacterium]